MSKKFLAAIRAQNTALEVGKERGKRLHTDPIERAEQGKFRRNLKPEEIMSVYNISYRYELTRVGGYKVLGRGN